MPDREAPPPYRTAAEVLGRARALFTMADHEFMLSESPILRRTFGSEDSPEDHRSRTAAIGTLAAAGAQLALALQAQEDAELAEDVTEALGPYPTPLGQPPTIATNGYVERLEAWRDDIADAARVATNQHRAPKASDRLDATVEVRRLLTQIPYREDEDDGG